jgi:flagellar basal-body rod protein FlgF
MERGLYVAAAGMLAEWVRQDQLSNDLANANTAGYKAERSRQTDFRQHLLHNTRTGQTVGELGEGPIVSETVTNWDRQALKDTGEPLDVAVDGEGFFAVRTDAGTRYTRNGEFTAGADGTLVDQMGNAVLGPDGQPVKLEADGTVDPQKVGLFTLPEPVKAGNGYVTGTPANGTPGGTVRTGKLETSGVDATRTMVDMMASLRAFEAGQKVLNTIDQTLGQAAGQVGSLNG